VDVVGEGFHVRELVVGMEEAVGVALAFPGVVDVDVGVAGVFHAGGDEVVGGGADIFVSDSAGEEVPTVPAHGGRGGGDGGGLGGGWRGVAGDEGEGSKSGKTERGGDAHDGAFRDLDCSGLGFCENDFSGNSKLAAQGEAMAAAVSLRLRTKEGLRS